MFYILISIASGGIVVLSRILNTVLTDSIGLMESSFFNYLTGFISSVILFFIMKETMDFSNFSNAPIWAYLGGLIGVIIVILSSVVTPKMSVFYISLIIFIGQLFTGIVLDYLTVKTIPFNKIIGGLLVVGGLLYNIRIDSLATNKN